MDVVQQALQAASKALAGMADSGVTAGVIVVDTNGNVVSSDADAKSKRQDEALSQIASIATAASS